MPWKVRADALGGKYTDPELFVDLKTTSNFENWERSAYDMAYDVQASWYTLPWRMAGCKPRFIFIVAETVAPHRVAVVEQTEFSRLERELEILNRYTNRNETLKRQERWKWTLGGIPSWQQVKREAMLDVSLKSLSYGAEAEAL